MIVCNKCNEFIGAEHECIKYKIIAYNRSPHCIYSDSLIKAVEKYLEMLYKYDTLEIGEEIELTIKYKNKNYNKEDYIRKIFKNAWEY